MSYLLEILGKGLVADLQSALGDCVDEDDPRSTDELIAAAQAPDAERATRHLLAARLLGDRQLARARSAYLGLVEQDASDVLAHIGLACALDELGITEQALDQLNFCRGVAPPDARLLFAVGMCCERLGRLDDAAHAYEDALDVCGDLRNTHERLAAIALRQGDVDNAIAHYEYLCWCDPGDHSAALSLANLYVRAKRWTDAVRKYEFVLSLEPDHWEVYDDLALVYEQAGDVDKAIAVLGELAREQPEKPEFHVRLGDLYLRKRDHERSLAEYVEAWELNHDHIEVTVKLGTSYLRRGDCVEAAQWFSRAVEINDQTVSALVGLGVARHALGQHDEAEKAFQSAAAAEPNSTVLFSEVARLQLKVIAAEQRDAALGEWAAHVNADLGGVLGEGLGEKTLGAAAAKAGGSFEGVLGGGLGGTALKSVNAMVQAQVDHLRQQIDEYPDHADLHYRLGVLLRHLSDTQGAIAGFREALAINPRYLKALNALGIALREIGSDDEARALFERGLSIDADEADLHYQLGLLFADRERFESAVEHFQRASDLCPNEIEFHAHLALTLQNMGLLDRAASVWQTLMAVAPRSRKGRTLLDDLASS